MRGGFNLVTISNGHSPALVHIPVRGRSFGRARWSPVNVGGSAVCPCSAVTGNTVWRNHIMGLFVPNSSPVPHTYLATVRTTVAGVRRRRCGSDPVVGSDPHR